MRLLQKLKIQTKDGQVKPFKLNKAQLHYQQHRTGRDIILKARQMGFTTFEQLRKLEKALLRKNHTTATVAHKRDKTQDIFRMAQYAWNALDDNFKAAYTVKFDSVRELAFQNTNSRYFVDIELRSGTVQDLHVSEVAFRKDLQKLFSSTLETVPKDGDITLETTANGLNEFHELWLEAVEGKNEFTPHFYNWLWDAGYTQDTPVSDEWIGHYREVADKYALIRDIDTRFNLTPEQFYWYYLKAVRLKEEVKQEYPTTPEEAFLTSSRTVFDLIDIANLQAAEVISKEKGVLIFEQPIVNNKYIIGADTSEGVGRDYSTIEVVNVTDTGLAVNVASFRDNKIRPDQLAQQMAWLGRKYNNAFLIPEKNNSGLTTTIKLQNMNYPNMYQKTTVDKKTNKTQNEYGWRTMASNRDLMIDDFIEAFEEGTIEIRSPYAINEMKTFVRKDNGVREHDDGFHDDSLFALFLAVQGRKYYRSRQPTIQNAAVIGI